MDKTENQVRMPDLGHAQECEKSSEMSAEKERALKDLMTEMVQRYFGESAGCGLIDDEWEATEEDLKTIIAVREYTGLTFGGVVKFKCSIDSKTKRVAHTTYSINFGDAYFVSEQDALDYFFDKYGLRFKTWGDLEVAMYEEVDEKGNSTFIGGFCTHGVGNLIYA